jgi:pullulanase
MKTIRKLLIFVLFTFVNVIAISKLMTVSADSATTLVVHYYRFDQEYTGWNLWLWPHEPESLSGLSYAFNGEDGFGKVLTQTLTGTNMENSTKVGFIIRKGEWVEKDVDQDRFIDLTNPNEDGEVHVFLVQNNPIVFYSLEDADIAHKILSAAFIDENTIGFTLTKSIVAADLKVFEDNIEIPTSGFSFSGSTGTVNIGISADLTKKYRLEVDFGDPEVATSSIGFDGFYTSDAFNEAYGYEGELGAIYTSASTTFRLWAPISDDVKLNLYMAGHTLAQLDYEGNAGVNTPYVTYDMTYTEKGVWEVIVNGDLEGKYYTFEVTNGLYTNEVVDPYAYSTGINGKRGMVVDFEKANPIGWEDDSRPDTMVHYTDAVIYEIHVRDYTSHETWNGTESYRGKFLGLTERGTTYESYTTGLDHMIELGVTHVQFVPIFDHGIIDETRLNDPTYYGIHDGIFNWGYMPENFNTLEGSYSTDPYDGYNRITEFKQMVNVFHNNDLRVIMDVVYNHTGKSADSNFDLIIPGYYFRMNSNGSFSNGSGTGNETASERFMFRKFMVDSLLFYATEYNLDGFRFDLMKLHDVETMNAIVDALHEIDPTIMIFGEPWTGGTSLLPQGDSAYNANLDEMPGVAVFNDDTRDGIKGSVFTAAEKGFVQGNDFADSRVLLGVTGATPQTNLLVGALPKGPWAINPTQSINYVTAHDNNTLYDKLVLSTYETEDKLIRMQRQANAIILTSQGIPFLHGGVEILRTKPCVPGGDTCDSANRFDHNSYKSPDETNQIDWNLKVDNIETFNYYKSLIALRKMKDVFRQPTQELVADHLLIIPDTISGFVSYLLYDETDNYKTIYVLHNNGSATRDIKLHKGNWNVIATTDEFGAQIENGFETLYTLEGGTFIEMKPNDTMILYSTEIVEFEAIVYEETPEGNEGLGAGAIVAIVTGSVAVIGAPTAWFIIRKKRLLKAL